MATDDPCDEYERQHPIGPGQRYWHDDLVVSELARWGAGCNTSGTWDPVVDVGQILAPVICLQVDVPATWNWCNVGLMLICLDGMKLTVCASTLIMFYLSHVRYRACEAFTPPLQLDGYRHAFIIQVAGKSEFSGLLTVTLSCILESRPIFRKQTAEFSDVVFAFHDGCRKRKREDDSECPAIEKGRALDEQSK